MKTAKVFILTLLSVFVLPHLFYEPLTWAAEKDKPFGSSTRECVLKLMPLPASIVVEAARKSELSELSLREAESRAISYLAKLPIFTDQFLSNHPQINNEIGKIIRLFSGSISASVMGLDRKSGEMVEQIINQLKKIGINQLNKAQLLATVMEASEDPAIYRPYSMASFILQGRPSLESVFFNLEKLVPGVDQLEFPGVNYFGPFAVGPRQMEIVRSALQYSQTRPGDRVLEIGYGTPSTLIALSAFINAKLIGVDPFVLPDQANEILKSRNVELVRGLFLDDGLVMDRLNSLGPFSLILALDTLKPNPQVLETSKSPLAHARALYRLLADGGVAVILNDFEQGPYFSKEEARRAGFNIVRWGALRPLPPSLKALMPYSPGTPNAGTMSLSVLRRGEVRFERVNVIER
jgi:SAM-dependent methyltransferase